MNDIIDLIVTRENKDSFGYVLQTPSVALSTSMYNTAQATISHQEAAPNIPLNVGLATPTQPGGQYDVRDSDGDKAITHVDWSLGAGQESLDAEGASASMFLNSKNLEVGVKGQLKLSKKLDFSTLPNASGPVYSALGYFWVACEGGDVFYSQDGASWTKATIDVDTGGPIYSFTTDGTHVFFCVPSGSVPGIWKSTLSTPISFSKVGSTGLVDIEYANGMLYGATTTGAGHLDPSTYVYKEDTMVFLADNITIGLDVVTNGVYWVASQGEQTFIYSLIYNSVTDVVTTTEVTRLRSGFIGTCTLGYLDALYIGGYLADKTNSLGQGTVYVISELGAVDGSKAKTIPLVHIGSDSTRHPEYPDEDLDTRVWAMASGGDKLYLECSRAIYVWDIDDGGYHHLCDFTSPIVGLPTGASATDAFEGGAYQVSAFQTSEIVYESVVHPGLAYNHGRLCAVYIADSGEKVIDFTLSNTSPSVFTSVANHELSNGQYIVISNGSGTPACSGGWIVQNVSAKTFTLIGAATGTAYNSSTNGVATVTYNADRGVAVTSDSYAPVGELITSGSNFHTGSMLKDFFVVSVSRDKLNAGDSVAVSYKIDNGSWTMAPVKSSSEVQTIYTIAKRGYFITLKISIMGGGTTTPVVRAVNCVWNFYPIRRHTYELDCRTGAAEGRWTESPEAAIKHLYDAAAEHVTFQDRFSGEYEGTIEKLEYQQAGWSALEGVSGLVTIQVRQVE